MDDFVFLFDWTHVSCNRCSKFISVFFQIIWSYRLLIFRDFPPQVFHSVASLNLFCFFILQWVRGKDVPAFVGQCSLRWGVLLVSLEKHKACACSGMGMLWVEPRRAHISFWQCFPAPNPHHGDHVWQNVCTQLNFALIRQNGYI